MKRRWFQLHLSTAIVLMLVAAGLLWLNVTAISIAEIDSFNFIDHNANAKLCYGWPWFFHVQNAAQTPTVNWIAVVFDLLCFILIVCAVGIAIECILNRQWPFQLQRTTSLVLLGVLCILFALNESEGVFQTSDFLAFDADLERYGRSLKYYYPGEFNWKAYGWPLIHGYRMFNGNVTNSYWSSSRLVANLIVAVAILAIVVMALKLIIRRREARKP